MVARSAEESPVYLGPLDASFLQVACPICKDASFRGPTSKSDAQQEPIGMTDSAQLLASDIVKPMARIASAPPILETAALQAELEAERARSAALEVQLAAAKKVRANAKAAQNEARKLEGKSSLRTKEATKAEIQAAEAVLAAPGVLRVRVVSATGLAAADGNGLSDPYATVFHRAMPEVVHKTHVMRKTLDPEWDEQFDFHDTLDQMIAAPLDVEIFDQDNGGLSKQLLGRVSLPLRDEVVSGKAMEGALNTQGSVKLYVSFAPLKPLLSSSVHIKKRGISGGRYTMHTVTLSRAEGFAGWSSHRLAYRDSQAVEHAATVIGMQDNAPMRYEYTIVTHENQGYSIRNGTSDEYKQWTEVIKQIVPPPLSRGHAEEAVDGEVPAKKKSIFSRVVGGKKKSTTE